MTGAKYEVMDADVPVVESGGRNDFQYARDEVDAGFRPRTSIASCTMATRSPSAAPCSPRTSPPATPKARPHGPSTRPRTAATLHVVIVGSPNVNPGYKLVRQQGVSADRRRLPPPDSKCSRACPATSSSARTAVTSTCKEKYERWKAGDRNAFIDPDGIQGATSPIASRHSKRN